MIDSGISKVVRVACHKMASLGLIIVDIQFPF